jgi:anti-anti-sigma regulatory factor
MHPGEEPRIEAWGELCVSTVPELQACVLRAMDERPAGLLVVDLHRVWFCDLTGLRSLWWLADRGEAFGIDVQVRESDAIARIGLLVDHLRAARIA